jgi:coenzyme F420 hydrogenase subunit beta
MKNVYRKGANYMQEIDSTNAALLPCQVLEEKVWQKNLCSGCRACIAVCLADSLAYDHNRNCPIQVNPCIDCKACLDACPRLPTNVEIIVSPDIIGPYLEIRNVRSKKSSMRFQNGGAASALLAAALDEGLVDCALVMGLDRWSQKPHSRVIYDSSELEKCAGSKYTSNEVLESVKDLIKDQHIKNIAIVGTPCSVQAVGLLRASSNEYAIKLAQKVRFLLGLFCFEAFSDPVIAKITSIVGQPSWRIDKLSAGEGQMTVTLRDKSIQTVPLPTLAEFVKPGCTGCADFTAKLSDISIGGLGSAPGMSSVVIRTPEGMGLFKIAEELGFIESWDGVRVEAIEKVGKFKLKKNKILFS